MRAIQSIFNQTVDDWELILVDDGSTDNTFQLVSPFLKEIRFEYFFQENAGVSKARNLGAERATGDWLIFLDSDDELTSDALMHFKNCINSHSDSQLIVAGNEQISPSTSVVYLPSQGEYRSFLSGSFCVSRSVFIDAGGYDSKLLFSENTELFHRIRLQNVKISTLQVVTLTYYISKNGGSRNLQNMSDSILLILDKHRDTLSIHVKYLYHQILGVNQMRFQNFEEARKQLFHAWTLKPYKISTLGRLLIAMFPRLARKLYPTEIGLK
ncbi:hypothetical protein GCM10009119_38500 [Algoriphagus jejuensis]|uniref:Glycosyltransferase 2-like domain-containing protein n=1 Tax=Algoriphagus jejuensis TaxID=419934 RepID=A0ABN1N4L5_9BACT